ncbi:unnamed protein product, partial [Mesorhabditis belari]|uniref:Uncharacterized protein n=1 Tax=Mesorhabditis belari TaxID=2138241 RepID=A0AAF3FE84_9BILA
MTGSSTKHHPNVFNGYGLFGEDHCFKACGTEEFIKMAQKASSLISTSENCVLILTGLMVISAFAVGVWGLAFLFLKNLERRDRVHYYRVKRSQSLDRFSSAHLIINKTQSS